MEPIRLPEALRPRPNMDELAAATCVYWGVPEANGEQIRELPEKYWPSPTLDDAVAAVATALVHGALSPGQAEAVAAALRKLQDVTAEKPSDEWNR